MSTRVNLKRPGTGLHKLNISYDGLNESRSNLRQPLLGTFAEDNRYVVEIKELVADLNSTNITFDKEQTLFYVFGKHRNQNVRNAGGQFIGDNHFIGVRQATPMQNNNGVSLAFESEFVFKIPRTSSVKDLLFQMTKKIDRISDVLLCCGWTDVLGISSEFDGLSPHSVGSLTVGTSPVFLDSDCFERIAQKPERLIELVINSKGNIGFKATSAFWNSFGIYCSPYFQRLAGFPELIVRDDDVFGEINSTNLNIFSRELNEDGATLFATKNINITCEERQCVLIRCDIPIEPEFSCKNQDEMMELDYVFAYYEFEHGTFLTGRSISNTSVSNQWFLESDNICGRYLMNRDQQTGAVGLLRHSMIPSVNFKAFLRRRLWNFATNEYEEVDEPLLKDKRDHLFAKIQFTLQL